MVAAERAGKARAHHGHIRSMRLDKVYIHVVEKHTHTRMRRRSEKSLCSNGGCSYVSNKYNMRELFKKLVLFKCRAH